MHVVTVYAGERFVVNTTLRAERGHGGSEEGEWGEARPLRVKGRPERVNSE